MFKEGKKKFAPACERVSLNKCELLFVLIGIYCKSLALRATSSREKYYIHGSEIIARNDWTSQNGAANFSTNSWADTTAFQLLLGRQAFAKIRRSRRLR